jgi:hypothetical protein
VVGFEAHAFTFFLGMFDVIGEFAASYRRYYESDCWSQPSVTAIQLPPPAVTPSSGLVSLPEFLFLIHCNNYSKHGLLDFVLSIFGLDVLFDRRLMETFHFCDYWKLHLCSFHFICVSLKRKLTCP